MALLYQLGVDPTRIYEGTDTRAFGLLLGATLAMVWPSRRLGTYLTLRRRMLLDGAGVVGLVVIALLIWRTDQYSAFLYRGGMVLLSVATVVVVAAVVHPASRLGPSLGWGPLRWLGVRSYGIYLWHWPIIVLTTPTAQRGITPSLAALQVGATIAVAALSWRFVEEPIRRGALERFWEQVRSGEWLRGGRPTTNRPTTDLSSPTPAAVCRRRGLGGSARRPGAGRRRPIGGDQRWRRRRKRIAAAFRKSPCEEDLHVRRSCYRSTHRRCHPGELVAEGH